MSSPPKRIRSALQQMKSGAVQYRETPLHSHSGGSFRVTLLKDGPEECGHSVEDPGDVGQWYFPDESVIVIDLEVADGE
jgi:hypothetical protein